MLEYLAAAVAVAAASGRDRCRVMERFVAVVLTPLVKHKRNMPDYLAGHLHTRRSAVRPQMMS